MLLPSDIPQGCRIRPSSPRPPIQKAADFAVAPLAVVADIRLRPGDAPKDAEQVLLCQFHCRVLLFFFSRVGCLFFTHPNGAYYNIFLRDKARGYFNLSLMPNK